EERDDVEMAGLLRRRDDDDGGGGWFRGVDEIGCS
ncbi:hypothetical protein A2U01_0089621, partial [Trifolium medium]|nr:hypothetical protein [Trifolium medium]